MARFDVRVAAGALGVEPDWLGVLLTRFPVVGVTRGRRGRTRTLSLDAVVCAGIAHALVRDAGVPPEPALALAHRLIRETTGEVRFGDGALRLAIDIAEARRQVAIALAHAVERSVEVPRGRPPARRRT